jgi:hypothetical protein
MEARSITKLEVCLFVLLLKMYVTSIVLIFSNLLSNYVNEVLEIRAEGVTFFEQYFYLIHWCDWLSYYLALEHEQDPTEVRVIDNLESLFK